MSFVESIDAFFGDFAVAATLPSTAVVMGIFDKAGQVGGVLGMAATEPSFVAKTSDLASLAYGSAISIGGASYTVRQVVPDGVGLTTLVLEG